MRTYRRCFVIMPFGRKSTPDGVIVDFDTVYQELLKPAIIEADLMPHRADADRRGGSIHADMFQELLLAEFVVADLTLDNPNVWYEIGVRHALRAGGTVLVYALRDRLPFDICGQRMQRYTLKDGALDPRHLADERTAITATIKATLGAWRGRRASPVYQELPSLKEPDWKTLKVGNVNEYWQALDDWRSRIAVARAKKRPADILVLAEEMPNATLELEALRAAADALKAVNRPDYALQVIDRALKVDPDDVKALQLRGSMLGRLGRFAEARELLLRLAQKQQDGETLGLLGRTLKDDWRRSWMAESDITSDARAAALKAEGMLHAAATAYVDAFRAAPADYYPGINAVTLGRLWEDLTGRQFDPPLDMLSAGVRWAVMAAPGWRKSFWSLATIAELDLAAPSPAAKTAYSNACAVAIADRDWWALDSARQQLHLLHKLEFKRAIVEEALLAFDDAEKNLAHLHDAKTDDGSKVILFSGHMVDDPAVRGAGKEKEPRFPAEKADAAKARIEAALDELGAKQGDLGICGGACGGDLLFAAACLDRRMRVELRLARIRTKFMVESVTFADKDRRWEKAFLKVTADARVRVYEMPVELGPTPDGISVHDRCNRWILHTALSMGPDRVSFLALWDGRDGDGRGGTQHMVDLVREATGRQPLIIDPHEL